MGKKSTIDDLPDLGLAFDGFEDPNISGFVSTEAKHRKARSPIGSVIKGALTGAKDTVKSPSFIKETIRRSLPREYGDIASSLEEIGTTAGELYDEASKELKPRLGNIVEQLGQLVPENQKTLTAIIDKLKRMTGVQSNRPESSTQNPQDAAVAQMLSEVFDNQGDQIRRQEAREIVRDTASRKRDVIFGASMGRIERTLSDLASYQRKVTSAYQKRSLELQMRSYLVQAETLSMTKRYFEAFRMQNEALVQNTSLPDFVKITKTEQFKEIARGKIMGKVQDKLFGDGSQIKRMMASLKETGSNFIAGLGGSLDMAAFGIESAVSMRESIEQMNEMLVQMGEEPITREEMIGGMIGENVITSLRNLITDRVRKKTDKNNKLKEQLAKFASKFMNAQGTIDSFRRQDSWQEKMNDYSTPKGMFFNFVDAVLDNMSERDPSRKFRAGTDLKDLDKPMPGITRRMNISIVDVIPGYLASIQRELTILRTGKETDLRIYDYQRGQFVEGRKMAKRVKGLLQKEAMRSGLGFTTQRSVAEFSENEPLTPDTNLNLQIFFSRLARIPNIEYTADNIRSLRIYEALDPTTKEFVDKRLDALFEGDSKEQNKYKFTKNIQEIRRTMPSMEETMNSLITAGHGDMLVKEGLVSRDPESGDFEVNEDRFRAFLEKNAIIQSDTNVKKNIKPMKATDVLKEFGKKMMSGLGRKDKRNPRAAFDAINRTQNFSWEYRNSKDGNQSFTGPMAQSSLHNFGQDTAPDGKAIDLKSMNGYNIAAIQYLGSRLDNIEKGRDGKPDLLKLIQQDVAAIRSGIGTIGGVAIGAISSGGGSAAPGSYKELFMSMMATGSSLASKTAGDIMDFGKFAYQTGKTKAFDPMVEYLKKTYRDNKDPFKEKLSMLFGKAVDIGSSALDTARGFISNTIPELAKSGKELFNKATKRVKDFINEVRDVYIPGHVTPIIQAVKLRAGFYRNSQTGEPIFTMDELMSCKADIVDSLGNVVLTLEDKANGLYDRYGDRIRSTFSEVTRMIGAGIRRADRFIRDTASSIMEGGGKLMGRMKEKMKGKFGGGLGGFGGGSSYDVLVDIRDILLGRKKDVLDRLKLKSNDLGLFSGLGSGGGGSATVTETSEDSGSQPYQQYRGVPGAFGRMMSSGKQAFDTLRNKYNNRNGGQPEMMGPAPEMVGPMPQKGKLGSVMDKIGRFGIPGKAGKLLGSARSFLGKGLGMAGGFLGGMLGDNDQNPNRPIMNQVEPQQEQYKPKKKTKTRIAQKDRAADDKDGDGLRDGSMEERRLKMEERKEEANAGAKAQADLSLKYKSPENIIDTIMSKFTGLFGMLSGGLGNLISGAGDLLSSAGGVKGLLGKGLTAAKGLGTTVMNTIGKKGLLRGALSSLGKGASGLIRFGVGNVARAATWTAMTSVSAVGSAALGALGSAATAIAGILSSPVVLGAAALAASGYGLYKLYKYVRRNDADEFQTIRMKQYGLMSSSVSNTYNEYAYLLEDYLMDGRVGYERGKAYILTKKVETQTLLDIFKIDKDDVDGAHEFADWYTRRFQPFFLTHLTALYAADNKAKLDEIKKLPASAQLKYLEAISFESGPYDLITSPFKAIPALSYEKDEVLALIKDLTFKVSEKAKKESNSKKTALPEKKSDPKKDATEAAKALEARSKMLGQQELDRTQRLIAERNAAANKRVTDALQAGAGDGDQRGAMQAVANQKLVNPPGTLPMAGGGILGGEAAMQFIKLRPGVTIDQLHPGVLKHFLGMVQEYGEKTGKSVQINDGFRSYAEQAALYSKNPGKAAKPGYSMHELGLAIDVNSADADEMEKLGLMKKYGFTRPVGGEPWHMEPAGIQANLGLAKSSASDRDMMVEASLRRGGGGYGTIDGATMRKRNNDLAMALLDIRANEVKDKTETVTKKLASLGNSPSANQPNFDSPTAPRASSYSESNKMVSRAPSGGYQKVSFTGNAEDEGEKKPSGAGGMPQQTVTGKDDVLKAIENGANRVGVDPNTLKAFAIMESDLKPNSRAPGGASGLFGFKPKTWDYQLGKAGSEFGIGGSASPTDPHASSVMAASYLRDNARTISRVKPNPNVTDLYLTNFLGPSGATKFLLTDPNTPGADAFPRAASENRNIFYSKEGRPYTVGEIYNNLGKKISDKSARFGVKVDSGLMPTQSSRSPASEKVMPVTPTSAAGVNRNTATPSQDSVASALSAVSERQKSRGFYTPPKPINMAQPTMTPIAPVSTEGIEKRLDKSIGVLEEIRDGIDKLPDGIAKALASSMPSKPAPQRGGITNASSQSSPALDLSRKVM